MLEKNSTDNQFSGKKALITGGGSGIGLAVAQKLLASGAEVIILGRQQKTLALATRMLGVGSSFFEADVARREQLEQVAAQIRQSAGRIDFLINCAGISKKQQPGIIDEEAFDELININLKGAYLCSMVFGYNLINRGGAIVNISSIRGRTGTPSFSPAYAAAKAGVINLTKSFALELASKGIRVNGVAPGPIYPTGVSQDWSPELIQEISRTIPLGRLGKPEEVADAAYFLVSDLSSYMTGQTLDVNGGLWMN